MAFWDFLKRPTPIAHFTPTVTHLGAGDLTAMLAGDMTPADMWRTQPHLRTVVSFLARNIAQLGLHSFARDGEDRVRDRTSAFAVAMSRPNSTQTAYELIYGLVGDLALYDRAYWLVQDEGDRFGIRRLPPAWVSVEWKNAFEPERFVVRNPSGQGTVDVSPDQVLSFTGYSPMSMRQGSPTVEALKGTLQEQLEAAKYRSQVWKRGGRVSAVLQRPADAPQWTDEQASRFRTDWYANYTGDGKKAGGTPILEDGMTLNRVDFTAQEQQFVEASKLAFSTVASAFHVNPTMVGILDNANYSNVREFRRMLYGDTLGPLIAQIEGRVNTFLLPMLGVDDATHYAEFNIAEKLQGSFEEQAAVMSTLVGRPIMTGDEGRAKFNLPALGGDMAETVTPLNVLIGGQASPRDSGSQNQRSLGATTTKALERALSKERAGDTYVAKHVEVLAAFFRRQGSVVRSAIGAGGDWWDSERWDRELSDDLTALTLLTSTSVAKAAIERAGLDVDDYDPDRTVAFLRAVAERVAAAVNVTTKKALDAAADAEAVSGVFDTAESTRAEQAAVTTVTAASAFGAIEAARQVGSEQPTKTWVVTSKNPRPSHAAMSGQTVGIDETFSNGAEWPADGNLSVDEVAGCTCEVFVEF